MCTGGQYPDPVIFDRNSFFHVCFGHSEEKSAGCKENCMVGKSVHLYFADEKVLIRTKNY